MNKTIKIFPFISLILTAMASGDKFLSFPYCIKMGSALLLIIIAVFSYVLFLRMKLKTKSDIG
ncbi:putative cell division protein FtsX [Paludibacter propionicigenes WB4]|uniref:Putative cell division protein FtsX n=1 Tax=Paludibacter propionicigenes (strain DSM 17365 / JCM 13257 / WB4) TaxID=694427 RepID=E4T0Q3_PALPW|nr:putative cell division protein FtsX [Paludibacter propionicigenes WB4]